jgi:integrase
VQFFAWCVENELVPASVHHGLKAVAGLRKGRTNVRESEPVKPVPDAYVDAIKPHVSRQIWTMIELQRLTGARPGEICIMRTIDLDMTGRIWEYVPERHKCEHHGSERRIYLGPKAQEVVRPWLRTDLDAYLFSPKEAEAERLAEMRRKRKTPVQPSQIDRSKPGHARQYGDHYKELAYHRAVKRGCEKAGVPPFAPNRLRHNAATMLRKQFGIDIARVILGHSNLVTAAVYAEIDREKAIRVMAEVG